MKEGMELRRLEVAGDDAARGKGLTRDTEAFIWGVVNKYVPVLYGPRSSPVAGRGTSCHKRLSSSTTVRHGPVKNITLLTVVISLAQVLNNSKHDWIVGWRIVFCACGILIGARVPLLKMAQ